MKLITIALILIITEILLQWFNRYVSTDEKVKRIVSIVVVIVVIVALLFARFSGREL